MPENHTVIVTPTDRLNHLTSILPIPARQPGVASPSVLVLAQHTRSLHDSACMCVCSEEGLFTSIFTHINVLSVRVTHPVILRFPIRFCLCVTIFKHECEISQRLKLSSKCGIEIILICEVNSCLPQTGSFLLYIDNPVTFSLAIIKPELTQESRWDAKLIQQYTLILFLLMHYY